MAITKTKPFYQSKTYLSLIPLIVILFNRVLDIGVTEVEVTQIMEAVGLIISMAIVTYGRYNASHKLTLGSKDKKEIEKQ